MNVTDFKTLLSKADSRRRSLTAGSLLREDDAQSAVLNALLYLRGILAGNPQLFRSEGDFFDWMSVRKKARQIADMRIEANGWDSSRVDEVLENHRKALELWNDPLWDQQTGRHEYRHTLSACDEADLLPPDFRDRFRSLDHLHLWSFGMLTSLPPLPAGLKTLDLRNAWALLSLPALPRTLETLDLSGCRSLKALPVQPLRNLKRLYLGGCAALTQQAFDAFWGQSDCAAAIEEIEVHGNAWVRELSLPADCPRLRVVRASDCSNLDTLPVWKGWRELEHLDLRGNARIRTLPELPVKNLRYLGLHGCDLLHNYLGQDLSERDNGTRRDDNAAGNFRLRTRLGRDTCERPRCKLLFLGNGRGGKTTLAKALQWRELDEAGRVRRKEELEPKLDEDVSHAIQQWDWTTDLPLPNLRGVPPALIRIWDFGGQETYHGTHRVFAASGALYILVLREGDPEPRDPKGRIPDADWKHLNRQRTAQYWLDYILDLDRRHGARREARARVLLVHTAHAGGPSRRGILDTLKDRRREIVAGEWWIGALPNEWNASQFEHEFRTALKKELLRQVKEEGIRIPRLFQEVADEIQRRAAGVQTVNDRGAILKWDAWKTLLDECAAQCGAPPDGLDRRDAEAIARMLHQSGEIFWMHAHDSSVILHQPAALKEIYRLLDFRETRLDAFRDQVKAKYGLFDGRELRERWWSGFAPEVQSQLIEFMTLCEICVPVFKAGDDGVVGEPLLALDPTLLPQFQSIEGRLNSRFYMPGFEADKKSWQLLARRGPFSESGFRAIQARAVRQAGIDPERGVFVWWNGLQYTDPDSAIGFRLEWIGAMGNQDAYSGSLRVQYWKSANGESEPPSLTALKQWLMGPGSPFPIEDWGLQEDGQVIATPERRDIAISVRRSQAAQAQLLKDALLSIHHAGKRLNVFLYISEDQVDATGSLYDAIRKARIQLLWISHEYLESNTDNPDSKSDNHVTLNELANAIFTWARWQGIAVDPVHLKDLPEKKDQRVVIVYQDSGAFRFLNRKDGAVFGDRTYAALNSMVEHHVQQVVKLATERRDTVSESKHAEKFKAAAALSRAFCDFYTGKLAGKSLLLSEAPSGPEEFAALAERLVRLLAGQAAEN